ncbi:MAG: hypothetical protein V3S64_10015 [bacterium]
MIGSVLGSAGGAVQAAMLNVKADLRAAASAVSTANTMMTMQGL